MTAIYDAGNQYMATLRLANGELVFDPEQPDMSLFYELNYFQDFIASTNSEFSDTPVETYVKELCKKYNERDELTFALPTFIPQQQNHELFTSKLTDGATWILADEVKCRKCHKKTVLYFEKQIRSADEGTTVFFKCTTCGLAWRQN